jgi:soluble lytic murein transglycosylase-like protein
VPESGFTFFLTGKYKAEMATVRKRLQFTDIILATLASLMVAGGFLACSSQAQAETCLRVKKNGVIYYFFSDRGAKNTAPPVWRRPTTLANRDPRSRVGPQKLQPVIHEASQRYGLPPALIQAVIRVESNFNPEATSPKGAQGLMQLMPATATDLQVTNPYDMRENILAGSRYLHLLLKKFQHKLPHALAAYNAGPHRVEKWQDVPPIAETQEFVRNVCVHFLNYKAEKATEP